MDKQIKKPKIIAVLGPTSAGKTKLAVFLALKFNGEIVSADSRQVYRGMDVGTGKDLREYSIINYQLSIKNKESKITKVPYHLIDIVNPNTKFNLARYQKLAFKAIDDILKRGKLPILVGGTGLYLQAVVDNYQLSNLKPDLELRKKLESLTAARLFSKIKKLNPKIAGKINESDKQNKRRLIRYLELLELDGDFKTKAGKSKYDALLIGLTSRKEELEKRIYKRLIERLEKEDMIGEVRGLHKKGLSWKRLESFGLEYKFVSLYLQNKLSYNEMVEKLFIASRRFAKRQMSWFKRWEKQGRKITWVKNKREAASLTKASL